MFKLMHILAYLPREFAKKCHLEGLFLKFCWLALSSASVPVSRPCHVSSPLRVARSVRISRTARPHLLRLKAYGTYHAGAAFNP
jgi:hypothetical protein